MKQEIIYGIRPVVESLWSGRRKVFEVLDAGGNEEVAEAANRRGAKVRRVSRQRVDDLARGGVHQGVVARVEPYPYSGLEEILSLPIPWSSSSTASPIHATSGPSCAPPTARGPAGSSSRKTAPLAYGVRCQGERGGQRARRVARETNLKRAMERMKEAGLWLYAAEAGGTPYTDLDLAGPVGLVFGSEGRGVRRLVREACDGTVSVPMLGAVGSLNVSVAAAVLLYEARRRRGWP